MNDIELLNSVGINKILMAKDDPMRYFMRSIMAGLYLGGAVILSYSSGALLSTNYPEFSKIAVAVTFGIGLVAICFLGAELFTGNCLTTIIPVYDKKMHFLDIIPAWWICFVGNILGLFAVGALFILSGSFNTIFPTYLQSLMDAKLTFEPMQLLIKGILCNFLVCIAGYAGIKVKDDMVRLVMIMFFVAAFVLPGFEHCIANSGFFAMCVTQFGIGDSPFALMGVHMLIATLGNIIGGSIVAGIPVYLMFKTKY